MENEGKPQSPKVVEVKTEEQFAEFIRIHALSFGANRFLADMTPEERAKFFVTVSKTYRQEWNAALQQLASEHGGGATTGL